MSYQNEKPAAVDALIQDGWTFVDVRTVEEFEAGHVPGAYNIPIAFRMAFGMQPNEDFVDAIQKHFQPDHKLVFG